MREIRKDSITDIIETHYSIFKNYDIEPIKEILGKTNFHLDDAVLLKRIERIQNENNNYNKNSENKDKKD
jgi:hypothetical protein